MTDGTSVKVALVGLGFGAEFIPIYQLHPDAELVAICQRTQSKLDEIGEKYGIAKRYASFEELLADPDVHAVHINSPIPEHGRQTIQVLRPSRSHSGQGQVWLDACWLPSSRHSRLASTWRAPCRWPPRLTSVDKSWSL